MRIAWFRQRRTHGSIEDVDVYSGVWIMHGITFLHFIELIGAGSVRSPPHRTAVGGGRAALAPDVSKCFFCEAEMSEPANKATEGKGRRELEGNWGLRWLWYLMESCALCRGALGVRDMWCGLAAARAARLCGMSRVNREHTLHSRSRHQSSNFISDPRIPWAWRIRRDTDLTRRRRRDRVSEV